MRVRGGSSPRCGCGGPDRNTTKLSMGAVAASRPTMRWRGELQGATGPSAAAAATAERDSQEISLIGSFRELSSDWELPSDSGISQEIEVGVELTSISRRANRKGDTVRLLPSTSPDSSEFSGHSRIDWDDPVATHKILSRVRSQQSCSSPTCCRRTLSSLSPRKRI